MKKWMLRIEGDGDTPLDDVAQALVKMFKGVVKIVIEADGKIRDLPVIPPDPNAYTGSSGNAAG